MTNPNQEEAMKELRSLREDFAGAVANTKHGKIMSVLLGTKNANIAFQNRLDELDGAMKKAFSPVASERQEAVSTIAGFKEEFDSLIAEHPKDSPDKWHMYSYKIGNIVRLLQS